MRYVITAAHEGKTIKEFLYGKLGMSRAAVIRLKKREDGIMLCGEHATVRAVLHVGDKLDILYDDTPDDMNENIVSTPMPLEILYEDNDVIVCSKPPNMPTHPSHGHYDDTLANGLAAYFGDRGIPFVFRAVNRLDSDTSGTVLVAKNKYAAAVMSRQLYSGLIQKRYLAVLYGEVENDGGVIERNIGRAQKSIIFREVKTDGSGDAAMTRYAVLKRYLAFGEKLTAVEAEPVTGRTHQLRVHFMSEGHSIIGDRLYPPCGFLTDEGRCECEKLISRQALHAVSLSFLKVSDGKRITVKAPIPEDIKGILPPDFEYVSRLG